MQEKIRDKFLNLLRELFEFDCADLDFGIYRIMNYKRAVIERFITKDLPKTITEELQHGALAEQGQAQKALKEARQKVLEALGEDALDADGNLNEKYRNTKAGREYLEALAKAQGARSTESLETAVYNHLYTFFSRYWQDGDFISKRRYSKKERYAIPYNGEEVYLYWANHDQYYIKTGEHFTDYSWKAPNGVTVHFKLQQADVEQNNIKGEKHFFLPVLDGIAWDGEARTLTIPFHFRPLAKEETERYGQKKQQEAIIAQAIKEETERNGQKKQQKAIIAQAVEEIPKYIKAAEARAALTAEHRRTENGKAVSQLEHHLRQYTRRNTSDFFIHKDLKGFLSRELDFYLKNEVLNLDEMEAAGERLAEGWFQLLRLIKRVGLTIIEFLAQIENFQKMLWEKKKFITETFYVITVGSIPEEFHEEIAECEAQWAEWKELLAIHELSKDLFSDDIKTPDEDCLASLKAHPTDPELHEKQKQKQKQEQKKAARLAFLKAHPTLPLDTRHFPLDFTDRLLASFENLDDLTDGLLIHSENWQALNLLQETYRERVKCIYIDPPYNTGNDDFLYRDAYQHSSWLAMMYDRMILASGMMREDGLFFVNIDDHEGDRLRLCMDSIFGRENFIASMIWRKRAGGGSDSKFVSIDHDYVLMYSKKITHAIVNRLSANPKNYPHQDREGRYTTKPLHNPGLRDSEGLHYDIECPDGTILKGEDHQWVYAYSTFEEKKKMGRIIFRKQRGKWKVYYKLYMHESEGAVPRSILYEVALNSEGRANLKKLGLDQNDSSANNSKLVQKYSYPKPNELLKYLILIGSFDKTTILDYFAGSGTTGHAVINLNREDGGRRKFILVEMAHYFDTVLLPRIKKVTFSPEWKDGKPKRRATQEEAERSPRLVKVIRLESYEDALNNLSFDDESGQKALDLFGEEYLLRYMLRWETRHSETLLDVEKLQSPFSYKLRLHRDGETRERAVDLPETFNYLLGLDVQTRKVYENGGRRYLVYRGTLRNGRTVAVIWREAQGWTKEDYKHDRKFVDENKLTDGADEVFLNSDSLIPGAQSLDGLFRECMFASVKE